MLLKSEVTYAADLVGAGVDGVAAAWRESRGLMRRPGWTPAAVGAALGLLTACLNRKQSRPGYRLAVGGVMGSAMGFGAGAVWTSRSLIKTAASAAARRINAVRDAHWLENNPIDYA